MDDATLVIRFLIFTLLELSASVWQDSKRKKKIIDMANNLLCVNSDAGYPKHMTIYFCSSIYVRLYELCNKFSFPLSFRAGYVYLWRFVKDLFPQTRSKEISKKSSKIYAKYSQFLDIISEWPLHGCITKKNSITRMSRHPQKPIQVCCISIFLLMQLHNFFSSHTKFSRILSMLADVNELKTFYC